MKKVIITGSKGTIGQVLLKGLRGYKIEGLDLPDFDILDYKNLRDKIKNTDVIIHLAWANFNANSDHISPINIEMANNIYRASIEMKIPRLIMASSIQADDFRNYDKKELLSIDKIPTPVSAYGATKVFIESLGRYYSNNNDLEVICPRFGGINDLDDKKEGEYSRIYLSHEDCISAVDKCIFAKVVPNKFSVFYVVSDNKNKIHNIANDFDWNPI